MANESKGTARDQSQVGGDVADVPPWGTPPETRPPGQPGYTWEPEPDPQLTQRSRPQYEEASQGLLALVLGLVGLLLFPPVAPAAWIVGRREVRAVDRGRRNPRNRVLGQIGLVLGIVGSAVLVVGVVLVGVMLALLFTLITSLLHL